MTPRDGKIKTLKFGDMIQFRSYTKRQGNKTVWRMVTGWKEDKPTVRFYGQHRFAVKLEEILNIET